LIAPRALGGPLGALLGVALLSLGTGGILLSANGEPRPDPRVLEGNLALNPEADDPGALIAHNSPAVERNPSDPSNLAVASRVDEPDFSCGLSVSADGGRRWSATAIPVPGDEKCYTPDVAFGAEGTLYVSFVTLTGKGNVPDAAWVASSADGGRTLSRPTRVVRGSVFQVRMAADPDAPRRLYVTWLAARDVALRRLPTVGNPIRSARSEDGGRTWSPPVQVNDSRRVRVLAGSPAVGADGDLYVAYLDLLEDRLDYEGEHEGRGGPPYQGRWQLVLSRSQDRGRTWFERVIERRLVPTERFISLLPPFPSLAVDRHRNRVFVGFQDGSLGDSDVVVWASSDRGAHWTRRRVNDTPSRDRTTQSLPELAVAPNGRLDVVYYDRRADSADVRNEVSLQSSTGDGSFSPRLRLSDRAFDSRIGFGSERNLADLGSRLGLVSADARVLAVWSDTRAGSASIRRQDLARALVRFDNGEGGTSALRWLLRAVSAAVALAGLALLIGLALRRLRADGIGREDAM